MNTTASARKSHFSPRPGSTMTGVTGGGGTVVYGVDEEFAKSTEGILSIIKILCGAMAWILMATLPYTQMIYTGGETGKFHVCMAFLIIGWLITVFFFVIRLGGWLMDNKFWANTTTSKGVFALNLGCALVYVIAGAILASGAKQFDMGWSAMSAYGGQQGTYNRYGYETQGSVRETEQQGGSTDKVEFGGCDNFNVNQPYCGRYPQECRNYFEECMKLASGIGYNKYYINAIVCVVFIFITVILHLISAVIACKGTAEEYLADEGDDVANDVEVTNVDLNTSLRSHSWKRSQKRSNRGDEQTSIINEKPRDTSTVKSHKSSREALGNLI